MLFKQFCSWVLIALCLTILPLHHVVATDNNSSTPHKSLAAKQIKSQGLPLIEQGRLFYEAGQYAQAIATLQPAIELYRSQQDLTRVAMVFNNLALSYQQLHDYEAAAANLDRSMKLIQSQSPSPEQQTILAQALDIRGKLNLVRGQGESAWENWQQAANVYQSLDNKTGVVRSRINQAQALQTLGYYRRAAKTLEQLTADESIDSSVSWRSLGNTYLAMGEMDRAEKALGRSLSLSEAANASEETSASYLSLGNLARSQQEQDRAVSYYQKAIATASDSTTEVRVRLNLLDLLATDGAEYQQELKQIEALLTQLPQNRSGIYAKIDYAQHLIEFDNAQAARLTRKAAYSTAEASSVSEFLQATIADARQLGDRTAEAYGLQALGTLQSQKQQWQLARQSTEQALIIAQEIDARDIAYQAQWQLGRIYRTQKQPQQAISAYQQAVEILQSLRNDLVAVNPEVRFTFRESIEPIYRQYVSLLLDSQEPGTQNLVAARSAIDSLQLAELENFFQATCLDAQPVAIDNITDTEDLTTAVIYPIMLEDRFEIILKLPQQPLRHYTTPIDNPERTERILDRLSQTFSQRNSSETLPLSQLVYSWIIKPAAAELAQNQIKTLVFVLDTALRNIPMSALHDGNQYLIENYAVAITPGLQLIQPQALAERQLQTLTAGLTEARSGFPPLKHVATELDTIQSQIPTTERLLDRNFTNDALQQQLAQIPYSIVHLATHGQFSSEAKNTFVLTWDRQIDINRLSQLLNLNDRRDRAIELLVLSACETLTGDRRAALGLAGVAVKAGARSTLATLWRVNDEATSLLMGRFYEALADRNSNINKAEAVRQAQLALLKSDLYQQPHFWASYVLVGNWL